jgi:hypothetical protein
MPLLGCVRAGGAREGVHERIPSHVNEAVEMVLGATRVEGRHLRAEVVDRDHGSHFVCHIVRMRG